MFVQPNRRLFIDTNIFMDTHSKWEGGLKRLFERCKDEALAHQNPIVVPPKVVGELEKYAGKTSSRVVGDSVNAVRNARKWLVAIDSAESVGLVRTDLGDDSNPYADDLFVDLFGRFVGKYEMCLVTDDITLQLRVRALAAKSGWSHVAGSVTADGLLSIDSPLDLYRRGARKLRIEQQKLDAGDPGPRRREEVAMLLQALPEFQQAFKIAPNAEKPGRGPSVHQTRLASANRGQPFEAAAALKAPDQFLGVTPIPSKGDDVLFESAHGHGTLVLGEMIGEGGEGRVFDVVGRPDRVVKVFDAEHRTAHRREKLSLLMSREFEREGIGLPRSVISNIQGEFVGYEMPRAAGKELQATVMRPARFKKTYPDWTKGDLVEVCISFLEKVAYLHSLNIMLGDINPKNLMVDATKEVWIIDADSWQLEGYPSPVGTPMFTAHTVKGDYSGALRTREEELFAVATMLFMILITGQHPYNRAGTDGDITRLIKEGVFPYQLGERRGADQPEGQWKYMWSHLHPRVKAMFWHSFHRDGDHYTNRPTANDWLRVFREYKRFLGSSENFDPQSNDVYPTRLKARARDTPIYACEVCDASMAGRWQKDRGSYATPRLCDNCRQNQPRCADCGRSKAPDSLKDGRCWECNRKRAEQLDPSRLCADCRQPFITFKHVGWFTSKGLEVAKSHEKIHLSCPPRPPSTTRPRSTSPRKTPSTAPSSPPQKGLLARLLDFFWN